MTYVLKVFNNVEFKAAIKVILREKLPGILITRQCMILL